MHDDRWMVRRWAVLAAIGAVAGTVGACGPSGLRWENPAVAEELWTTQRDECRRQATVRAEREFVTLDQPDPGAEFGRPTTLRSEVARFDAGRRREALFESCMRDRGYRRAAGGGEDG